jgi:hypothetical protein
MKANILYVALTRPRDKGQINFCDISNHTPISYHDYTYEATTNYATLFYLIESNHLYEITCPHEQKTISHRQQLNKFKHKEAKVTTRRVIVFYKPREILLMLGLCKADDGEYVYNIEECKNVIFVCATPSVVHDLFYLLLKLNQLHNKNVRNDNTRIIQFDIVQYKLTIQENTSYNDVAATIQTLNAISSNTTPYIYTGQTIHRLAHEYYEQIIITITNQRCRRR